MPTYQDAGTGLLGVFQGIQQARDRDMEIQRGQEKLKLEQDKLKLMQREVEQTGQSQLFDALYKQKSLEQPKVVGKSLVSPGGQPLYTEPTSLKDLILNLQEGGTAFSLGQGESGGVSATEIAKGTPKVTTANSPTAAIKNAKALVSAAKKKGVELPEMDALMISLVGDPELMAAEAAQKMFSADFRAQRLPLDEQLKKMQEYMDIARSIYVRGGTEDDELFR